MYDSRGQAAIQEEGVRGNERATKCACTWAVKSAQVRVLHVRIQRHVRKVTSQPSNPHQRRVVLTLRKHERVPTQFVSLYIDKAFEENSGQNKVELRVKKNCTWCRLCPRAPAVPCTCTHPIRIHVAVNSLRNSRTCRANSSRMRGCARVCGAERHRERSKDAAGLRA